MRKAQKEQAEHIIQLLGHVHDGIRKAVEKGQYDDARGLLSQCQESAIELGETIEEIEGEDFVTVSFLEHYCEAVYQAYTLLGQVQGVNAAKLHKNLRRALIAAENSVKNDIRVRTEAVFLPYKASMWDSLESVWKAADEDPDCDAYVIPIPYFDKNPDGSFREMHYEGDLYPDYVPVTRYEEYDFAEHHPDMIFIHNPYDNCNYVTSVHPFFYAQNLKQFTEQLVYIPYFILGEPDLENEESIKGMAHFCTVPGVIYADKVIVQSEAMRQAYVRVMVEFTAGRWNGEPGIQSAGGSGGESKANVQKSVIKTNSGGLNRNLLDKNSEAKVKAAASRKYWEEKILGCGSPKIDKVLRTKKEELEIPQEWLQVIEKPDGSWKKIIFYNTSVTALLKYGEKMLGKIQDVFQVFEKSRNEIVLLWRPHPLIKATIESMRAELWRGYEAIVKQYCEAGWGIYDDSADLDRAIEISDAYYGDTSSIVRLCQEAGKDVLIQDLNFNNNVSQKIVSTEAILEVENSYWFVPFYGKTLFKMDKNTYEIEAVAHLEEAREIALYIGIVGFKEKLLFIPKTAEKIAVFDKQSHNVRYLNFRNGNSAHPYNSSFLNYHVKNEILFLIPQGYNSIVRINMETEQIDGIVVSEESKKECICTGSSVMLEGEIYIPFLDENCVLICDIGSLRIKKVFPSGKKKKYTHIFEDKGKIWLIPYDISDGVHIWNVKNNEIEDIISFPIQILCQQEKGKLYFFDGIKYGRKYFALAGGNQYNVAIDMDTKEITAWNIMPHYNKKAEAIWYRNLRQLAFFRTQEDLYVISGMTGEWFQYYNDEWVILKANSQVKNNEAMLLDNKFVFLKKTLISEKENDFCGKQIYKVLGTYE